MAIDLAFETRERKVLAAVADGIVAAAAGRALRVAVACSPAHLTFAGQLTRALHARGRACNCITPMPDGSPPDRPATGSDPVDPAVAMIVSSPVPTGGEVYRVSVCLVDECPQNPPSGDPAAGDGGRSGPAAEVVVDYGDPTGPVLRRFTTDEGLVADRTADENRTAGT
ncbi:hypothetical protein [Micromonospora coxensis]|uniref:Uncharacterized protein n=1 Tax=Micromonospora coxensis TaxID=356852 RepID=A0A1C5K0T9_9ACTN|nr:hypothetical protein [Micromonospora coxensis]SCG76149.1 hypothetical protein GA0070614_5856 [Micromonospora coxensis]